MNKQFTYLWATEEHDSALDYTVINLNHITSIQMAKKGFKITLVNSKVLIAPYHEMSVSSLPVDTDIVFVHKDWQEANSNFDIMKFKATN